MVDTIKDQIWLRVGKEPATLFSTFPRLRALLPNVNTSTLKFFRSALSQPRWNK